MKTRPVDARVIFIVLLATCILMGCQPDQATERQSPGETNTQPSAQSNEEQEQMCDVFTIEHPEPNTSLRGEIRVDGIHNCGLSEHIWIVLSDGHGYYLQAPAVSLYRGTWVHEKVILGGGIRSIIAVWVDNNGNEEFLRKVENREFGQFQRLPTGSKILDNVPIHN